jgi:hypothetical protein
MTHNFGGTTDDIVRVRTIEQLSRITDRGLNPTLPPQARVTLDLVPAIVAQRPVWERQVARWASACGCRTSAATSLIIAGLFALFHTIGRVDVASVHLPQVIAWILGVLGVAVTSKLVLIIYARHVLSKLHKSIAVVADTKRGTVR